MTSAECYPGMLVCCINTNDLPKAIEGKLKRGATYTVLSVEGAFCQIKEIDKVLGRQANLFLHRFVPVDLQYPITCKQEE